MTPPIRMVFVPVEWHREDAEHCRLIYSLMQKGWRKGQPVMVNDVMIRIETCHGSETDIGPITDAIQSALTAAPVREEGGAVRPVNIVRASGSIEQQKEIVRTSETYKRGDTVLVWVNEGDLYANPFVELEDLSALATREEAPAEAGEPCEHQPGCDCTVAEEDVARSKPPLRAQPQAREESQPDLVAIRREQWVPCSPEWLDKHPNGCAEAPRVAAKEWDGHSHYHPANWPTPPAPEAETKEQLAKRLIGEVVAEENLRVAVEASKFLLDRLDDLERDVNERDFYGHVSPAASRLRQALAALQQEER